VALVKQAFISYELFLHPCKETRCLQRRKSHHFVMTGNAKPLDCLETPVIKFIKMNFSYQ